MAWVQDYHYMSISTPLGKDKLLLRRFDGEESLSRPFHFSLDMQSEDGAIDFASIVGKSATITIELADGTQLIRPATARQLSTLVTPIPIGGGAPDGICIPVGNAGNITAYWMGYQ